MRLCAKGWISALLVSLPLAAGAATCTSQGELQPQDRSALGAAGEKLSQAIVQQNFSGLQASLFSAVAGDWDGIRSAIESAAPVVKGGQVQLQDVYLLDASTATAPADTQFFCSNASGSLTVTINLRSLPPGKYAVILANASGAPLGGEIGLILVWDPTSQPAEWKMGGVSIRQGIVEGHDGVWYWSRGRSLAEGGSAWAAWFSYEMARHLLLPFDFISSPNMDKLLHEQSQIKGAPEFPYSLPDGARTWKIDGIAADTTLHDPDLGVTYDSLGITDPGAEHTEATAVLSALLKAHPDLRTNFHGMWALASRDGKVTPVMELPMAKIP